MLNRGNCRQDIFTKAGDFASFIKLLEQARRRIPSVRILGYCLMHNHWHLVLWPRRGTDLSRFMLWLGTTHVRRWRAHRPDSAPGHLYQGRFKSFLCQSDEHFLTLLRYVEANALRAGMVKRAHDWPWSSLRNPAGADGLRIELTDWPVEKPRNWSALVNRPLERATLEKLHTSVARGRPFGDDQWLARTVRRLHLESTLRNPWRPSKKKANDQFKEAQQNGK